MTEWQEFHFIDELKRLGINFHKVNCLNISSEGLVKKVDLIINSSKIDIVINTLSDEIFNEEIINKCSSLGVPIILLCFDNLHNPYVNLKYLKFYDTVWLTSYENIELFKKRGAKNILFQPYASNPYVFKPKKNNQIDKLLFLGSSYGFRANMLNFLVQNSVPISITQSSNTNKKTKINNPIKQLKSVLNTLSNFDDVIQRKLFLSKIISLLKSNKELLKVGLVDFIPPPDFCDVSDYYSSYLLSLNITELRNTGLLLNPVHKLHLRTFEICMSGGAQITKKNNELENYFLQDKEIIFYESQEELLSKINFYLKNQHLILKIKTNARERSIRDHTWENRFLKLFQSI
jgi:spore maturation protein CgeB